MLIVEDNNEMRSLLKQVHLTHQNPNASAQLGINSEIIPFRKIKESPLFAAKNQSPSLQIADFCAYVIKKSAVTDMKFDDLWKTISPLIIQMPDPDLPSEIKSA